MLTHSNIDKKATKKINISRFPLYCAPARAKNTQLSGEADKALELNFEHP